MDDLTRRLTDYAVGLSFADLPLEVVQSATQRVVDSLACAIGGYESEPAAIGRRLAAGSRPERYPGRLLGSAEFATAESAAFANTAAIRNLDFNDAWEGGHPSDCLGALFALAESAEADGRRFLTAMTVAYEVFMNLSTAGQFRQRGWDQGFAIGIATAAAVANLLQLPPEQVGHGLAITAVGNVPLRATRAGQLSLWKGAATSYAIRNAAFGMLLAAEGMTGPDRPFEGRHGLWEQITGPFELAAFGGQGGEFRLPAVRMKYWPVEGGAQAAVWAAQKVRTLAEADDLDRIVVSTHWGTWQEIGSEPEKWDPRTRETADHSLPYIFARTLLDGTIGLPAFEEQAFLDPSIRPLMAKIEVRTDDAIEALWPENVAMRVDFTTRAGRTQSVEILNPVGHRLNPMRAADTTEKFKTLALPVYGEQRTAALLDRWWRLEQASTLAEPLALLER
jgi:2-methylcitrate dehydratase